jgi:hypothetical protein
MREICKSGSEGGGALTGSPYPYTSGPRRVLRQTVSKLDLAS